MTALRRLARLLVLSFALASLGWPATAQSPAPAPTDSSAPATTGPARVKVGVYINDIQAIDLRNHTFAADLYIWFRNSDPSLVPGATFEFMNLAAPNDHVQTALQQAPADQPDGSKYELYRHQGQFVTKFSVRKFPFDRQVLRMELEDQLSAADRLQYVVDEISMNPNVQLPGYRIGKPGLMVVDRAYPTAFGDLANPEALPYSRAIITLPIARPVLSGVVKTFLPILIIMLVAAAALVLDPTHVDARVGLAITALLTLVALQFTASQTLPEVGYLLMLDQVYLASYAFILVVVAMLVRSTRMDDIGLIRGTPSALHKLILGGPALAFVAVLIYLLIVGVILIFNLT